MCKINPEYKEHPTTKGNEKVIYLVLNTYLVYSISKYS